LPDWLVLKADHENSADNLVFPLILSCHVCQYRIRCWVRISYGDQAKVAQGYMQCPLFGILPSLGVRRRRSSKSAIDSQVILLTESFVGSGPCARSKCSELPGRRPGTPTYAYHQSMMLTFRSACLPLSIDRHFLSCVRSPSPARLRHLAQISLLSRACYSSMDPRNNWLPLPNWWSTSQGEAS
jgi:hypothetical protein